MATDANKSGDPNGNNEKVTFTPEQQARIDEIIREAQGRAGQEHKNAAVAATARATELEQELATATAELAKARTSREKKDASDDVEALKAQIQEMKHANATRDTELERLRQTVVGKDRDVVAAKNEALAIRKEVAMQRAASRCNFVDVGIVTQVTEKSIKFDDATGRFVVLAENGTERLNAAYEPMSLDDFYSEFASKNPYLVRGDMRSGAGSVESQRSGLAMDGKFTVEQVFGLKSDAALANKLAQTNMAEYRRLKQIARERKLI